MKMPASKSSPTLNSTSRVQRPSVLTSALLAGLVLGSAGCASSMPRMDAEEPVESAVHVAPADEPFELQRPAAAGWQAIVAMDTGGVGVWTVLGADVADDWGGQELVAADDEGNAWLLVPYSGRWTQKRAVSDEKWLGALAVADLDPERPGRELLAGGELGNLFLVSYRLLGGADVRRIAEFPGEELHTVLAGDFDPGRAGLECLAFTSPGMAYLLRGEQVEPLGPTRGRVRDALVVAPGPVLLTAARSGVLERWNFTTLPPERELLWQLDTGVGRLARDPATGVIYAGTDDGRILRIEASQLTAAAGLRGTSETIHAGPLGVRGIATGDFDGSGREQVAFAGYDGKVHLLARTSADSWSDLVLYDDEAKLHWLSSVELDGRNSSPELVCSGYAGRVVLLRHGTSPD